MSAPLTTFAFETLNFLLLAAGLGWLFFRPVRRSLETRRAQMSNQAQEAAAKMSEAEQMREQAASRIAAAEQETQRMRDDARAEARKEADAIRSAARLAADQELRSSRERLHGLEQAEAERLADAVAAGAAQAIQHLMSQLDLGDLDRSLAQLAGRELHARTDKGSGLVFVESARPLDPQIKDELAGSLNGQSVEFRTNAELIGGVRITSAGGLIDASVLGLADYARRALAEQLVAGPNGNGSPVGIKVQETLHG